MPIIPYLYYEDVDRMLAWLAKAFGFKRHGIGMKGADGKTDHAAMRTADGVFMMGRPPAARGYRNPRRIGQTTQSLCIDVIGDLDRHCARATRAGARMLEEPHDTGYGQRRYRAEDPEGHEWCLTQDLKARGGKGRQGSVRPRQRRSRKGAGR
jgi:uncharacterized glyoxalase superfamily protein PhnB